MTLKETKSKLKLMAAQIKADRKQLRADQREGKPVNQWALQCDANEFRLWHIAYCLARGRTYEQIEPKVREGNEPRWDKIEKIQSQIILAEQARLAEKDPEVDHVPA